MRLLELRLRDFRQFAALDARFDAGLNVIHGANGAGKSTVLEGIVWALYGADTVRRSELSLRRLGAATGAVTSAELRFAGDNGEFVVRRALAVEYGAAAPTAELRTGAGDVMASGDDAVTEAVAAATGADRERFLHTCVTGRRELQQLAQLRPADRLRMLARFLGRSVPRRAPMDHQLLEAVHALQQELREADERIEALRTAPELLARYTTELERLRPELAQAEAHAEQLHDEWSQKRQDVDTRLHACRRRADELHHQIERLAAAGPDGRCPTCEQPLGAHVDRIVARLDDEVYVNAQDMKWLAQRLEQLERRPPDLAGAETRRTRLRSAVDDRAQRAARCEQAAQELWTVAGERQRAAERLASVRANAPPARGGGREPGGQPLGRADLDAVAARAGAALAHITAGRYDAIELRDDGRVYALKAGVAAPVLGGADEDLIALLLRRATMELAAGSGGGTEGAIGVMMLDEPFGNIDDGRFLRALELLAGSAGDGTQILLATRFSTAGCAAALLSLDGVGLPAP